MGTDSKQKTENSKQLILFVIRHSLFDIHINFGGFIPPFLFLYLIIHIVSQPFKVDFSARDGSAFGGIFKAKALRYIQK